jgi:uncharacterized protein (TIGR02452 family)
MSIRTRRSEEARSHVARVRGIFASETSTSISKAKIYEDGSSRDVELEEARFEKTDAYTAWTGIADVLASANGKVCVVDPAHFTKPGGGYMNGAWDIESQLCSESNLFPILEGLESVFHAGNRHYGRGGLNSDRAVYIEDVMFITNGKMVRRDVLAISPVNRKMALENNRSEPECDLDLCNRVNSIMNIAALNSADTLVLSDFGCGYMGNDADVVAGLFKRWLDEHPGQFETVIFAIAGGPALDDFRDVFPEKPREVVVQESQDVDMTEDEDDSTDVEPTSEGRWVFN